MSQTIKHQPKPPDELGFGISLIDGFDLHTPGRTGTYVIQAEQLTLIETGPSLSVPYILEGLKDLGLDAAQIRYIIVTHIHLDHAGGAGVLLKHCPQATVVVHPRGARHLANPTRLIAGARIVYGDQFDDLFDPILPVPEERLMIKQDGEHLDIDPKRRLTFYDTPGHAAHHFSIHDSHSNGIFTGDAAGVRYHQLLDQGLSFYLPSTSPNQFDPDQMLSTLDRISRLNVDRIYFGHYGADTNVEEVMQQNTDWLPRFLKAGEKAMSEGKGASGIEENLGQEIRQFLREKMVPDTHEVYNVLKMDFKVCALGLEDYLKKRANYEF